MFTHLNALDADAWLSHVFKALRPGGRVWSTWFCMDDEAIQSNKAGKTTINLGYEEDGVFWQTNERSPGAVGYALWKMQEMFDRHGFAVRSSTRGPWCERSNPTGGYQDAFVLLKP